MPLKRKICNLTKTNDQLSFFDPVYQRNGLSISDDDGNNDALADGVPRETFRANGMDAMADHKATDEMISKSNIVTRVKQIQNSMAQARTMLDSMRQLKHLIPDSDDQCQKLQTILANLEEQKTGYLHLLDLITLAAEERAVMVEREAPFIDPYEGNLSLRHHLQSSVRPRIESKIGFTAQQVVRPSHPNYESLLGSRKSDAITWKDQLSDEESSDEETEENLMLQKEEQRTLLALKYRPEQQKLNVNTRMSAEQADEEGDLLSDINTLRDRLKLLRNLYEQSHQGEIQRLKKSSAQGKLPADSRLRTLEHVGQRLDELESIVTSYRPDPSTKSTPSPQHALSTDYTPVQTKSFGQNYNVELDGNQTAAQHREIERCQSIKEEVSSLHQRMSTPPISPPSRASIRRPVFHFEWQQNSSSSEEDHDGFECFTDEVDEEPDEILPSRPSRLQQSNFLGSEVLMSTTNDLSFQMRDLTRCLSTFIDEQKEFNRRMEQRLTTPIQPSLATNELQQQVLTQGLLVNLNTAYREIAVLQSEINALRSENTRLASSISFDHQYRHAPQGHSNQSAETRAPRTMITRLKQQTRPLARRSRFDDASKTSLDSRSTGRQTAIRVDQIKVEETTPIKREDHRIFSTENISKEHERKQLYHFDPTQVKELPSCRLSRPSTTIQNLMNIDTNTLDLQVKCIMAPLVPFIRLHVDGKFDSNILGHVRDQMISLLKEHLDLNSSLEHLPHDVVASIERILDQYRETTVEENASNLIRDLSVMAFDELMKSKLDENNKPISITNSSVLIKQSNDYSHLYNASARYHAQERASVLDDEDDQNYQIELSESENRPLTLIGSDEEDNDSDQEESNEDELETAVSRQGSVVQANELNSNGHDYVIVNRLTDSKRIGDQQSPEDP